MSVPAAKALSPAPVIRIARIERSSFAWLQISARRSYIAKVSAFLACGRLKVTYATPSRTSCRSSSMDFFDYPSGPAGSLPFRRRRTSTSHRPIAAMSIRTAKMPKNARPASSPPDQVTRPPAPPTELVKWRSPGPNATQSNSSASEVTISAASGSCSFAGSSTSKPPKTNTSPAGMARNASGSAGFPALKMPSMASAMPIARTTTPTAILLNTRRSYLKEQADASPADERDPGRRGETAAPAEGFLGGDPQSHDRDPEAAHHPDDEQDAHQRPRGAETREAVAQRPHLRRAAKLQAGTLPRRER